MHKSLPLIVATILSSTIGTNPSEDKITKAPSIISGTDGGITLTSSVPPVDSSIEEDISDYEEYFSCPIYGPFAAGDENIDVTFDYKMKIESQTIVERLRVINSKGKVVSATTKAAKNYFANSLESVTFTLPIKANFNYAGLTIKFEILNNASRVVLREHSVEFFPKPILFPTAYQLKNNPYTTPKIAFYGDGTTLHPITETFDFTETNDYIDVDYYYRLNLSGLSFYYESVFDFEYESIDLRFKDADNLFPYYTHDESSYVYIPLDVVRDGDKYQTVYKNQFYINKKTLQISDTYQDGFVLTNDFYLPINGKQKFNNKSLYFEVNNLGKCGLSCLFLIKYSIDKSLVGLCDDGLHCVSGGSR